MKAKGFELATNERDDQVMTGECLGARQIRLSVEILHKA